MLLMSCRMMISGAEVCRFFSKIFEKRQAPTHTQTVDITPSVAHDTTMRKLLAIAAVLSTSSSVASDIRTVWKGK